VLLLLLLLGGVAVQTRAPHECSLLLRDDRGRCGCCGCCCSLRRGQLVMQVEWWGSK
jgi:hypothetical protein